MGALQDVTYDVKMKFPESSKPVVPKNVDQTTKFAEFTASYSLESDYLRGIASHCTSPAARSIRAASCNRPLRLPRNRPDGLYVPHIGSSGRVPTGSAQQLRFFFGEHGGDLPFGRAMDARVGPAFFPTIEIRLRFLQAFEAHPFEWGSFACGRRPIPLFLCDRDLGSGKAGPPRRSARARLETVG